MKPTYEELLALVAMLADDKIDWYCVPSNLPAIIWAMQERIEAAS